MKSRAVKYIGIPGAILSFAFAIGFTGYVFGINSGIERGKSSRDTEVSELQKRTEEQGKLIRDLYSALENSESEFDDSSNLISDKDLSFFPEVKY